ncbi:glycoside hydrolase family 28 protein [Arachidicoccus ginsenosidivorans]|nr:glycosyl hydrolase family 28 protein [Arachidicoccus ginsenosidivorans]
MTQKLNRGRHIFSRHFWRTTTFLIGILLLGSCIVNAQNNFPDGSAIPAWFSETTVPALDQMGTQYDLYKNGVTADSTVVQTEKIQAVIDKASAAGGGVIVLPKGVVLTGSLFFKPNTKLYIAKGATLKGSDDISDFKVISTRIEGQTVKYFAAIINADHVDGFSLTGGGTVNGNGLRYWKAFWLRRKWNPKCTNMDEQRPRLLFVSNCKNVLIANVSLINSPFWTSHYYKCEHLKILAVHIAAGTNNGFTVKAPSSDGIDLDVCQNVLVKGCYVSVNDDGLCLKGGKGPTADKDPNNGPNKNIIVENNTFVNCPALTLGSESVFTYNVILRNCVVNGGRVFYLKMRPDTPQKHNYVSVYGITGNASTFFEISAWRQFFDLKGHKPPHSSASNLTIRDCNVHCKTFIKIDSSDQYTLSNFTLANLKIKSPGKTYSVPDFIGNLQLKNIELDGKDWPAR